MTTAVLFITGATALVVVSSVHAALRIYLMQTDAEPSE